MGAFESTWLYQVPATLIANLGPLLLVLAGVLVIIGIVIMTLMYIAKGGGQYGIIEGYVGTIGAGKTTLAVQHALTLAKARNAVMLSNIPVRCGATCPGALPRGVYRPGEVLMLGHVIEHQTLPMNDDGLDLATLMSVAFRLRDEERGLVLLMDEVGVVMPARLWKDFPVGLMWLLQQSRKLACEWIWTAQDVSFVDHQLRSLTAVVHYVRAYPPPSIWRRSRGKRPWVLIASAFSPSAAPRANAEGMRPERRLGRSMKRYNRKWEASFDTDGVVLPSRHVKGAQILIDAARASGDVHVIEGTYGEPMGGDLSPGMVESEGASVG